MNKPSRRAVVRTGVWSVPVVAVATIAPAYATTSGNPPPVTITGVGSGCKLPGNPNDWSYRIVLNFKSTSSTAEAITILKFDISGAPTSTFSPATFTVPSGVSSKAFVVSSSNSANRSATITYTVEGQTYTVAVAVPTFHPCPDH